MALSPAGSLVLGLLVQLFGVVQQWLHVHGDELGGEEAFLAGLEELLSDGESASDDSSSGGELDVPQSSPTCRTQEMN